jgi:hypothetical protein
MESACIHHAEKSYATAGTVDLQIRTKNQKLFGIMRNCIFEHQTDYPDDQ